MKWKTFTPEEVRSLRENPYTLKVTDKTIAFTRAFKEQFWQGLQEGKPKHELLKELGYDPELLGSSRVEGISYPFLYAAKAPFVFRQKGLLVTNLRLARGTESYQSTAT